MQTIKNSNQSAKEKFVVTKEVNLGELVYNHPETAEVILDYGLHCVGCFASSVDTLEQGAKLHGLSDADIAELVDRLNEVIKFKE